MNSINFIWGVAILLFASPLVYLVGRLGVQQNILPRRTHFVRWTAMLAMAASWVPYILAVRDFSQNKFGYFQIGSIGLQVDGLSLLLAGLALGLGTLVMIFSGPYMADEIGEEKYYAMLLAMIGVIIGLGCASDLFNLWVWFEAMAVSSYLLVAFYRRQPAALESGIKYLVQSATGSVFVLFGIALVLANTGTLDLQHLRTSAQPSLGLLAAGALFIIGFGVKVAMVPMHTWLPDAHSQAPSGISAMLSGVVIETGLVALLRVISALAGVSTSWGLLLMIFGALNMFFGNFLALKQVASGAQAQVKRVLAYSSLSHVGYMLIGLGIAFYAGDAVLAAGRLGAQGAFFHIINHGIMKGLAFLAAGSLLYGLHLAFDRHDPLTMGDLNGAARRYPIPALALSLAVLGLGGLPPLAGFMSKWQIFVAGFQTKDGLVIGMVIFAALNSVLSLGYYAPMVNAMYRKEPSEAVQMGDTIPVSMLIPLGVLAVAVLVLGFAPGLMNWLTEPASLSLRAYFDGAAVWLGTMFQ